MPGDIRQSYDPDPDDLDDEYEMLMECDACDGDGWVSDGDVAIECPECGGDGWI